MRFSTSAKAILAALALSAFGFTSNASATPITVLPGDFGVTSGTVVTTQYSSTGLVFDDAKVFNDPPLAWSGTSSLVAPVIGHFMGVTDYISAEAGYVSGPSDLLLEVFDSSNTLIGSTIADDGTGPHGRLLMTLSIAGISSFRISTPTGDSFGVNQLSFNSPTKGVPEPASLGLMGLGLVTLVVSRRSRKKS